MIICNRTPEQARRDLAAGQLSSATLLRVPMSAASWSVRLSGSKGGSGMLLSLQTLEAEQFASLDAAVAALERIGFAVEQLKLG
ncbi:MAG: hypothetical protein ACJ8HI_00105 [Massilia sp.]